MIRHTITLLIGLIVLAIVYGTLMIIPFRAAWFLYLAHLVFMGLNAVWIASAVGLVMLGMACNRPGLMAAPPIFFACWFMASVVDRALVASSIDPALLRRDVPAGLRDVRSLTIVRLGSQTPVVSAKLLAEGTIDQYVEAIDEPKGRGPIRLTRLAPIQNCSPAEISASESLQASGRTEHCLQTTTIAAIPDGLVVRMVEQHPYGCCGEGTISIRRNGEESVATTWRWERRSVLSYMPLFGPVGDGPYPTTSLWRGGLGGPRQIVEVGKPRFSDTDLVAAVFGLDWSSAPDVVDIVPAELVRRAAAIAQGPNPRAALGLALHLQRQGHVDDELLAVVASMVERVASWDFWSNLAPGQKRKLLDLILDRIQDPSVGTDDLQVTFGTSLADEPDQSARVLQIFAERDDLRVWQYEVLLRLARDHRHQRMSQGYSDEQDRRLAVLERDRSNAFPRRAVAFRRVYSIETDREQELFGSRLDQVPDAMVGEFVRAAGWYRTPAGGPTPDTTRVLRDRAVIRIAAVSDEKLRHELQRRFRIDPGR